jgi:type I restriction enzyme S subunit
MRPTDALPHPADWTTTTVGKSVVVRRGVSWSKDQEHSEPRNGRIPVIRIGNVQERLDLDDVLYLSGLPAAVVRARSAGAGWTLVVGSNGNRQRVGNAVLLRDNADVLFASFVLAATPRDPSFLTADYFYRWIACDQVQAYLSASAEGTTGLNNLSHSFFRAMTIPVPPPAEQHAISLVLQRADDAIEAADAAVDAARMVRRGLLTDLLMYGIGQDGRLRDAGHDDQFAHSRLGTIPRDWRLSSVGQEFTLQTGITLNQARRGYYTRHHYLRVANVRREQVDLCDVQELGATETELASRRLQPKDLLVVEGHANRREIGRCALIPDAAAGMTFQNHLFRLRTRGPLVPEFACLWLNSEYAQRYWDARCGTSSGLNTINQRALRRLVVPVPEPREQKAIAELVAAQQAYIDELVTRRALLKDVKRALVDDLLTGRVRPALEFDRKAIPA